MVLSTLWKVYKSVYQRNEETLKTILNTIQITLTPRELKTNDEWNSREAALCREWLPV